LHDEHDRRRGRKEFRDFWRAWRDEEHRRWNDHDEHNWGPACPPPREIANAWREFFRGFMGDWPEGHWIFGGRRFSPWHQGMDSFNPFVASLLSKGGGLLPLYVLHLVSQKPRYGNEIMEIIAKRTGGQWVANPGAIYPLLTQLETHGLIEGIWEDPQKRTIRIYSLTKAGGQELIRLKAVVYPKLKETVGVLQELMQDLDGGESESNEPDEKEGNSTEQAG
jgi:PadR family transcriptional regulator PadR